MTFDELITAWRWKPIRNCPGRYRLVVGDVEPPSIEDQVGRDVRVHRHRVPEARDEVLVVALSEGCGLISYRRDNGKLVHTLNDEDGFARKLDQLGIDRGVADHDCSAPTETGK